MIRTILSNCSAPLFKIAVGATVAAVMGMAPAQAGTLHNGWTYSIDSFNDGTEGNIIGKNSKFEFYGMAYRQVGKNIEFAINSNLDWDQAYKYSGARNGSIGYGDLMINFGKNADGSQASFAAGEAANKMYAVHFDEDNDTRIGGKKVGLGLYSGVKTESLTTVNAGYSSVAQHKQYVTAYGGVDSYGDLAQSTTYFGAQTAAAQTHMKSGTLQQGINGITTNFANTGLDFGHFKATGTKTFGFTLDASKMPTGKFMASLFAECGNDGIALMGEIKDLKSVPTKVPEGSSGAGVLAIGAMVAAAAMRRKLGGGAGPDSFSPDFSA
jgi:hypothetical protein